MSDGYRLCVISDSTEVGGAERFLYNLLAALPEDVDVIALCTSPAVLEQVAAGRTRTHAELVDGTVTGFRHALARTAPDVVHLNLTAFTSCRAAGLACLSRRAPMVLVDHLPTPGLTWRGRTLQRLLTGASAARLAVGDATARDVERYGGLRAGTVLTVPNGVPDPGCIAGPLPENQLVVGALARLEHQKGLDVLLAALVGVPDVTALVAGDGSERVRLERSAEVLGVADRVRFLGPVGSPCDLLTQVHVLVMPSRWEAMPLAVLEAMHSGLPVIATDVGSIREVVADGETGIVVPPEDPEALARACSRLAADSALRTRLGNAGRIRAGREFSMAAMAARYDARYRAAVGLPPRGPRARSWTARG